MQTDIIQLSEQLLEKAIAHHASDIHIEPFSSQLQIRLRIDGLLQHTQHVPLALASAISSRLKLLCNLDITQRRLPQDGRFTFQQYDCRLSCCPTYHGEKLVIRLLNRQQRLLRLEQLGLLPEQMTVLQQTLSQPQGLILVTGPTGSGKTQSLYALLQSLDAKHHNIISIEDPVEIALDNINQINVNHSIGLDFATLLRATLRQDPDIIMIGEIRDPETAAMAVRAAHSGHRVLATLHTNSAQQSYQRLASLGVKPPDLEHCLSLIINQRLIRKLCPYCQKQGCEHCYQGYHQRTGLFELAPSTQSHSDVAHIKIASGITDRAEIMRVTAIA